MKKSIFLLFSVLFLLTYTIFGNVTIKNCTVYADINIAQTAKSALLVDYNSGTVIFEKNKDQKVPIASMVKLMTIYLTIKNLESGNLTLNQKITTSQNASSMGGSQVFIDPYVEYSVEDLLKSVIMASANDASVAIAEAISGSEESFVSLMNDTAKELHMENTLYANATGLPAPQQYSTANDCAIILKNILTFEDYHKYSNVWMDELIHPSGRKTELVNTNKLVKYFNGCDSGKTGSTSEAGYCLTASAKRDNMRLISVVIGAKTGKDRFKESTDLLNYGFANYQNKHIIKKDEVLKEVKTSKCKQTTAQIVATEDFFAFDKKGSKSNYEITYNIPDTIGKTKKGDIVGVAVVSNQGNVVKTINLTVNSDIEKTSFSDNFKSILQNW